MKRFIKIVAFIFALVATIVLWNGIQAVRAALDAEHTLHAYRLALELTNRYQETHAGEWPPDWKALEQLPYERGGMWEWPDDLAEIQERITIDFAANPRDVAELTPAEFTAISQRQPNFPGSSDPHVEQLIDGLRNSLGLPDK